ncbi:MAG: UDP-N-acetylmuramoyl-L-alanine--D-glutamate ligase [Clostridia bacterium]|nr:UDP-N-acetylmuramoyl-L-alanine--D-glutamate ligase [Clostridia bacterium]
MDFKNKQILIVGLARSGIAAAKILSEMGANIFVSDIKEQEQLLSEMNQLKDYNIQFYLGKMPDPLIDKVDIIVLSPGVPSDLPFVKKALDLGKEVISEVEAAYRICPAPIIAITGTNGKTTTTSLIYEIFKAAGENAFLSGNIGVPMIGQVEKVDKKDVVIAEISSFQLETIKHFKPKISAVLNITEDHLNRHKTLENYLKAKAKITINQTEDDFLIINEDDPRLKLIKGLSKARVIPFSRKKILETGAFIKDDKIIMGYDGKDQVICKVSDVSIPGLHNLENVLAAVAVSSVFKIGASTIKSTLKTFPGVEHRLEFVDQINDVIYINDSKGTNPDASIKALQSVDRPIVLIAGGMDKGSDFAEFLIAGKDKIKHLILLGETKDKIKQTAHEVGIKSIIVVNTLKEAVQQSSKVSKSGDAVLLSPACASWDMFDSFEERGRVFKQAVSNLRR